MVRTAAKKAKGDDAFTKRKQKVGRQKLAPATATQAEVHARGIRIGMSRKLAAATATLQEQQHLMTAGAKDAAVAAKLEEADRAAEEEVAASVDAAVAALHHYKGGTRTASYQTALRWLQQQQKTDRAATAASTPATMLRLLRASLQGLTDTENGVRTAAAKVIDLLARSAFASPAAWAPVADEVLLRLSVALTHAERGVRAAALELTQFLIENRPAHETFLAAVLSRRDNDPHVAQLLGHIVGISKAVRKFGSLRAVLALLVDHELDAAADAAMAGATAASATGSSSTSGSGEAAHMLGFASRCGPLMVDILRDIWAYAGTRLRESFQAHGALFRDQATMEQTIDLLACNSSLVRCACALRGTVADMPGGKFWNDMCRVTLSGLPFSMQELCGPASTSPRKAALAAALGRLYLFLAAAGAPESSALLKQARLIADVGAAGISTTASEESSSQAPSADGAAPAPAPPTPAPSASPSASTASSQLAASALELLALAARQRLFSPSRAAIASITLWLDRAAVAATDARAAGAVLAPALQGLRVLNVMLRREAGGVQAGAAGDDALVPTVAAIPKLLFMLRATPAAHAVVRLGVEVLHLAIVEAPVQRRAGPSAAWLALAARIPTLLGVPQGSAPGGWLGGLYFRSDLTHRRMLTSILHHAACVRSGSDGSGRAAGDAVAACAGALCEAVDERCTLLRAVFLTP